MKEYLNNLEHELNRLKSEIICARDSIYEIGKRFDYAMQYFSCLKGEINIMDFTLKEEFAPHNWDKDVLDSIEKRIIEELEKNGDILK